NQVNFYGDDVVVNEADGTVEITINISRPVDEDITLNYIAYPASYGYIRDDNTLGYVDRATEADFPNNEFPSGAFTIPAGSTSATFTFTVSNDGIAESKEYFIAYITSTTLSDGTEVRPASRYPQVTIKDSDVFYDVLNVSLDTLWRMSWDNRTWTIKGDDTDTVRLTGYESSWTQSDGTVYEYFEPFRKNGEQVIDDVTYVIYDLWDARVLIEKGITVIYKKRELEKTVPGENSSPNFWYRYKTVNEDQTEVFGKVRDSWDQDG
ncbi:uncharacterized protein METZ01_LOCUS433353, partial [marine metagenome]